jgi:hypothetical protein
VNRAVTVDVGAVTVGVVVGDGVVTVVVVVGVGGGVVTVGVVVGGALDPQEAVSAPADKHLDR